MRQREGGNTSMEVYAGNAQGYTSFCNVGGNETGHRG